MPEDTRKFQLVMDLFSSEGHSVKQASVRPSAFCGTLLLTTPLTWYKKMWGACLMKVDAYNAYQVLPVCLDDK